MKNYGVSLPDGDAARLDAAAAAAGVPADRFAAALLAQALEGGWSGAQTRPQAATGATPQAGGAQAQPVGGGQVECPDCGSEINLLPGGQEVPDEATVAALALAFLRGDQEGARVILSAVSLPLLIACAMAWWNGLGITEHGSADEWGRRLEAFLINAAARRANG